MKYIFFILLSVFCTSSVWASLDSAGGETIRLTCVKDSESIVALAISFLSTAQPAGSFSIMMENNTEIPISLKTDFEVIDSSQVRLLSSPNATQFYLTQVGVKFTLRYDITQDSYLQVHFTSSEYQGNEKFPLLKIHEKCVEVDITKLSTIEFSTWVNLKTLKNKKKRIGKIKGYNPDSMLEEEYILYIERL